jgi:hypothetical protein
MIIDALFPNKTIESSTEPECSPAAASLLAHALEIKHNETKH